MIVIIVIIMIYNDVLLLFFNQCSHGGGVDCRLTAGCRPNPLALGIQYFS